jgi:GTPase SAR1 family protein
MEDKRILMAGLPSSGKTTYLGALVHILDSEEVDTALKYNGTPKNRMYLTQLVERWLEFKKMERNLVGSDECIELNLINDDEKIVLTIPDLSGETWRTLWSSRHCDESVANLIEDANNLMFFIHCDKVFKPISVMEMKKHQNALGETSEQGTQSEACEKESEEWSPEKHCPTQVMAVDILQIIASKIKNGKQINLAIILSAWDTTLDLACTPREFTKESLPLLHQYLESSFDYPNFEIYGVSAQGGDLEGKGAELEQKKAKLDKFDIPSERVIIVGQEDYKHDLTFPIKKLLD